MREKSEFIAFRAAPEDAKRIKALASALGSGSMSAAVRWAVRNAPQPSTSSLAEPQPQPEGEARHV